MTLKLPKNFKSNKEVTGHFLIAPVTLDASPTHFEDENWKDRRRTSVVQFKKAAVFTVCYILVNEMCTIQCTEMCDTLAPES